MKRIFLAGIAAWLAFVALAQPPKMDISDLLKQDTELYLEYGMMSLGCAIKGCVGDFNNDGCDDFILTGLYVESIAGAVQNGFLHIYLGQKKGVPVLAYKDSNFPIAGNGAIDCYKLPDGSYLVALQGGAKNNWANPFRGEVYNLNVRDKEIDLKPVVELDNGAGRGSILFLDADADSYPDIYQVGWKAAVTWEPQANLYMNDGTNEWFEWMESDDFRPVANTFIVKGDLNNDGKVDLLQVVQGAALYAYFNKGNGAFDEKPVFNFVQGPEDARTLELVGEDDATQVELIDFDNDGWLDIVLTSASKHTDPWTYLVKLLKNNGDGTFTEIEQKDLNGNSTVFSGGLNSDFAVADFDQDGNVDFIIGTENEDANKERVYHTYFFKGNGHGAFDQFDITYDEEEYTMNIMAMSRHAEYGRFLVGDFDGNKTPDLLTAGPERYWGFVDLAIYFNTSEPVTRPGDAVVNPYVSAVSVFSSDAGLVINNAANSLLTIYSLTGAPVYQCAINADKVALKTDVRPGVYVIKVKDYVQRVVLY